MRRCIATHALYLANPAEADELVQETYKRALGAKRKPSSNTVAQIRPWMFTILRNIWQNERRRQSREHEVWLDDAVAPTTRESPETLMSQKLLVSEVREAVDSIPVHWRRSWSCETSKSFPTTRLRPSWAALSAL